MVGPPSLREAVKKGRKNLDVTQDTLANKSGCSRSAVANIERGQMPSRDVLRRIAEQFKEADRRAVFETAEARQILGDEVDGKGDPAERNGDDMINAFMKLRRSSDVDLSGKWNAMWLTTVDGKANRNREVIEVRRRWNGTWQFSNEAVSGDNPKGGYLWVARMELFDNRHLLGYYCARERNILAKGTLCLELQPNGREIVGVWDGLNFDTMWAKGLVAMTQTNGNYNPGEALDKFIRARPTMPYEEEK
jgi:transcriptional regulator with XRE-family HTH domain